MLKITKIARGGLSFFSLYDADWPGPTCNRGIGWWFMYVDRINFVRDGKHYSIQLGNIYGDFAIELRCKEDKDFFEVLGFGEKEFMKLLKGWDWKKLGSTYKTFPVDELEKIIFGGQNE